MDRQLPQVPGWPDGSNHLDPMGQSLDREPQAGQEGHGQVDQVNEADGRVRRHHGGQKDTKRGKRKDAQYDGRGQFGNLHCAEVHVGHGDTAE